MEINSVQWIHPSNTILAGPSGSGKTSLIDSILCNKDELFRGQPKKVILFYSVWQPIYKKWREAGFLSYSKEGIPDIQDFKNICNLYAKRGGCLCIFDDLGGSVIKHYDFFKEVFLVVSHHYNASIFLVLHNLFERGLRQISLNTHRFILTKSPRDKSQLSYFARACFPKTGSFIPDVYEKVCSKDFGYVILDFNQTSSELLRVTTSWFEKDSNIMVFQPKSSACNTSVKEKNQYTCLTLIPSDLYNILVDTKSNNVKTLEHTLVSSPNISVTGNASHSNYQQNVQNTNSDVPLETPPTDYVSSVQSFKTSFEPPLTPHSPQPYSATSIPSQDIIIPNQTVVTQSPSLSSTDPLLGAINPNITSSSKTPIHKPSIIRGGMRLPLTKQKESKNNISAMNVDNNGVSLPYPKPLSPRHQLAITSETKKNSAIGKNTLSKKKFIPPSFKNIFKTRKIGNKKAVTNSTLPQAVRTNEMVACSKTPLITSDTFNTSTISTDIEQSNTSNTPAGIPLEDILPLKTRKSKILKRKTEFKAKTSHPPKYVKANKGEKRGIPKNFSNSLNKRFKTKQKIFKPENNFEIWKL